MPSNSQPLAPYVDPESKLLVQSLQPTDAARLTERLPCLVHLLPHFRQEALNKFAGGEPDVYLSGCCPSGQGTQGERTGMVLYSIEKGRRGVVKLVCRLLCIDEMLVSAGRALLIPAAIMHKAQRIEAKINKKDEQQKAFWLGLGFELHEDIAEMPIDAALLGRVGATAAPPPPPVASPAAPQSSSSAAATRSPGGGGGGGGSSGGGGGAAPSSGKKRGRPSGSSKQQQPTPHTHQAGGDAQAPSGASAAKVAAMPPASHQTSDFVPIATDGAENDIDGAADEPVSDLYIRKTCPGRGEPHMVLMPCGEIPRDPAVWHLVPENELELGHTVQCLQCKITFAVDRDQAESAEVLFQDLE